MRKTAVVTGGAGFLGSHLCDRLEKEGMKVICIDNLITGSYNNLRYFKGPFIEHDVSRGMPKELKEDADYVFHFACPASPIDYLKYPIETMRVDSIGTFNTLEYAKKCRAIYMQASTSEVYGDPLIHPQVEEYWGNVNPIGPRSVYDEAKRFSEALVMAYHRKYKLNTRIIRIFNTYGPRMRVNDGRVVPTFIDQALNNKPLTVFGKGTQTRSFCYIDDEIEGIWRLAKTKYHYPVNVGNPNEFNMIELADLVLGLTKSKSKIIHKPLPVDDPKQRSPNIKLAKRLLKWEPKIQLKEGLEKTIEYFRGKRR